MYIKVIFWLLQETLDWNIILGREMFLSIGRKSDLLPVTVWEFINTETPETL